MMTHCLHVAGNLPIKTLVARQLPTITHAHHNLIHILKKCMPCSQSHSNPASDIGGICIHITIHLATSHINLCPNHCLHVPFNHLIQQTFLHSYTNHLHHINSAHTLFLYKSMHIDSCMITRAGQFPKVATIYVPLATLHPVDTHMFMYTSHPYLGYKIL